MPTLLLLRIPFGNLEDFVHAVFEHKVFLKYMWTNI
jgi:hypothetical protein